MRWHRIMNKSSYTCLSQMTLEFIAAQMAYNEQMPDRIHICWHKWQHQFWQSLQRVQNSNGRWTDLPSAQREMQSIKAGADADAMFRATIRSVFLLEAFKFAAKQIPTGIHDPMPRSIKLILKFKVGRLEAQKRNSHDWTLTTWNSEQSRK